MSLADVEIIDVEQNTPEWFAARSGVPTASDMKLVLMKGRGNEPSKMRRDYMVKLCGEILTGQPLQTWAGNEHTERGHRLEPEARALYAMLRDVEPQRVGFMRRRLANGHVGASPDSLIGETGLLEIKTKLPHLLLDCILTDEVPSEHYAQIQTQLWVTGREWCDFMAYWPKLPPFIERVKRDEPYIEKLRDETNKFLAELHDMLSIIQRYQEAA